MVFHILRTISYPSGLQNHFVHFEHQVHKQTSGIEATDVEMYRQLYTYLRTLEKGLCVKQRHYTSVTAMDSQKSRETRVTLWGG